jgi:hypothetical protein
MSRFQTALVVVALLAFVGAGVSHRLSEQPVTPEHTQPRKYGHVLESVLSTCLPGSRLYATIPEAELGAGERQSELWPNAPFPDRFGSGSSVSNGHVFSVNTHYVVHDWTPLGLEGEDIIRSLLQLADAQARALSAGDIHPVDSYGFSESLWQKSGAAPSEAEEVRVSRTREEHWGGTRSHSESAYSFDLRSPRLVHWRHYASTVAPVTTVVRMEYDQSSERLLVSLTFTDLSSPNARLPKASWWMTERVD